MKTDLGFIIIVPMKYIYIFNSTYIISSICNILICKILKYLSNGSNGSNGVSFKTI